MKHRLRVNNLLKQAQQETRVFSNPVYDILTRMTAMDEDAPEDEWDAITQELEDYSPGGNKYRSWDIQ